MARLRSPLVPVALLTGGLMVGAWILQERNDGPVGALPDAPPAHSVSLELEAIRIQPQDKDAADARERVAEAGEGVAVDDETWSEMVDLAESAVGMGTDTVVEEDREFGAVQAHRFTMLVDVKWLGEFAYLYYDTGDGIDDEFFAMLDRLRDEGFTIVQGYDLDVVNPQTTLDRMAAHQEHDYEEG